jgi:hypothetical protein
MCICGKVKFAFSDESLSGRKLVEEPSEFVADDTPAMVAADQRAKARPAPGTTTQRARRPHALANRLSPAIDVSRPENDMPTNLFNRQSENFATALKRLCVFFRRLSAPVACCRLIQEWTKMVNQTLCLPPLVEKPSVDLKIPIPIGGRSHLSTFDCCLLPLRKSRKQRQSG